MILISESWKATYPGAALGTLVMRSVLNPPTHPALDAAKKKLEDDLRARYGGYDRARLKSLPVIQAYNDYYAHFRKTYHVQLQLESIAFKGKSLPQVAALVEAMFMAELNNQLLTAAHDLDAARMPLRLEIASGIERYTLLNGQDQELKPGDMIMVDADGVICSVIYGADQRTRITPATRQVIFVVYAPPGISHQTVEAHLREIETNVLLIAPEAVTTSLKVYGTEEK